MTLGIKLLQLIMYNLRLVIMFVQQLMVCTLMVMLLVVLGLGIRLMPGLVLLQILVQLVVPDWKNPGRNLYSPNKAEFSVVLKEIASRVIMDRATSQLDMRN